MALKKLFLNPKLKMEEGVLYMREDNYSKFKAIGSYDDRNIFIHQFDYGDGHVTLVGEILEAEKAIHIIHQNKYVFLPKEFLTPRLKGKLVRFPLKHADKNYIYQVTKSYENTQLNMFGNELSL